MKNYSNQYVLDKTLKGIPCVRLDNFFQFHTFLGYVFCCLSVLLDYSLCLRLLTPIFKLIARYCVS